MKKQSWFIGVVILLLIGLAATLTAAPAQAGKMRVAVITFGASSSYGDYRVGWSWDELGAGVTDMFTTALFKTGRFDVIERNKLDSLLTEQGLATSGVVSPQTAVQMGKILGVQAIITGKITEFGTKQTGAHFAGFGGSLIQAKCAIDCRMINTTTGSIMMAESASSTGSTGSVHASRWEGLRVGGEGFDSTIIGQVTRETVNKLVEKIGGYSAFEGKIVYIKGNLVKINLGKGPGVTEGSTWEIFELGEAIVDPDTGEVLEMEEEKVGEIKLTKVKENLSDAEIISGKGVVKKGQIARPKK